MKIENYLTKKHIKFIKDYGLTNAESRIFIELIAGPITRERIFQILYLQNADSRAADVHISNLRKKLSDKYEIFSLRGTGYQMFTKEINKP